MTDPKPIVFVFPTFLAVGGVERNTAEVISYLKDNYDFVIVNFERLGEAHGSLHHQFFGNVIAIYDLTEIGSHDEISAYLKKLEFIYRPQLIWICNGSPWLAANTQTVRQIFSKSAIVDQQVYDTKYGWVNLYENRDPSVFKFERFIAINSRIYNRFIEEFGLDPDRVDLITSVISSEKRSSALKCEKEDLIKKFQLSNGRRYFAFIGRLTSQKAPIDFISLARHVISNGPDDIDFLVVGSGELEGAVSSLITDANLSCRVRRINFVENTFELLRVVDAIVFTSHYEGLPIALLEALSLGTPALCTDTGDIGSVLREYGGGLVFDAIGEVESLERGVDLFIANYASYKASAIKHMDAVASRYSMEAVQVKYRDCFQLALLASDKAETFC